MPAYRAGPPQFDTAQLAVQVRDRIAARGITRTQAAHEIGCSKGALHWLINQQQGPDTVSLVRILRWLHGDRSPLAQYETSDPERISQRPRTRTTVRLGPPGTPGRVRLTSMPQARFQEPEGT